MNENKSINSLKKQLVAAVAMVCVAAVALGSSTYAWFVNNNKVKAENMSVTAQSDVKFLEIQNVNVDFNGGTVAVDATNAGSKDVANGLKPVTPFEVDDLTKNGTENLDKIAVSSKQDADGYQDGIIWTWTVADKGNEAIKGADAEWTRAFVNGDTSSYYLLNNFKFRTTVAGDVTEKLYASTVDVTGLVANALDEAVRVMIVGTDGIQLYDVGENKWTYYKADGSIVDKSKFNGLISQIGYVQPNDNTQSVKVFVYYEGDDSRLFTSNLNSLQGVTVGITFSVDATTF